MSAATWACCCGWRVVVAGSRWASSLARTAQNRYRGARPHRAQLFLDALPTSDEASFDVVALSDVFEHVTEPRTFLATAARLLRPCGLLYVRVPNARRSILKQRLFRLRGDSQTRNAWDSYEHVVHYTERTLRATLQAEGFAPLLVTFSRPVQVPVWHEYVGQYYQYPSPWVLDWRRHLGRLGFYAAGKAERSLRRGEIGYCAPNLVALAQSGGMSFGLR